MEGKRTVRETKVDLLKKCARYQRKNWIAARAERETDDNQDKKRLILQVKVHRQP